MAECPYRCQNGFVFLESLGEKVPCPHCNGPERFVEMTRKDNPNNIFNVLRIPLQYRNLTASSDAFVIDAVSKAEAEGVNGGVADLLTNISNSIDKYKIYRISSMIHVNPSLAAKFGIDMNKFVYSMQMKALTKGIGVMPYISCRTLYLLLLNQNSELDIDPEVDVMSGATGRNTTLSTRLNNVCGFDYNDYINAPLVFIEAPCGTEERGWIAIIDLLSERSKLSLPTYVISYWDAYTTKKFGALFVYTRDTSRLDKLTPFEVVKAKENVPRKATPTLREVTSEMPDNLNPYGVKGTNNSNPIDTAPEQDFRDFI